MNKIRLDTQILRVVMKFKKFLFLLVKRDAMSLDKRIVPRIYLFYNDTSLRISDFM